MYKIAFIINSGKLCADVTMSTTINTLKMIV